VAGCPAVAAAVCSLLQSAGSVLEEAQRWEGAHCTAVPGSCRLEEAEGRYCTRCTAEEVVEHSYFGISNSHVCITRLMAEPRRAI
jgi:hypothetical protein